MQALSRSIIVLLVISLFPVQATAAQPTEAQWSPLATIPIGSERGQVGYDLQVEGGTARGPEALALAPSGDLFVLDSVNRRVLIVGSGQVRAVDVPAGYGRELLVTDDAMYILDDDNRILVVGHDGALRRAVALPDGMPTHEIFRLIESTARRIELWAGGYQVFDLDALPSAVDLEAKQQRKERAGRGVASPQGERWLGEGGALSGRFVVGGRREIPIQTYGTFGSARLVGFDRQARAYAVVEDLYDRGSQTGVELSVRRYTPAGFLAGAARIPAERFVIAPRRVVDVAPDGSVYVMVPSATALALYKVTLGLGYATRITAAMPTGSSGRAGMAKPLAWGTPYTRSTVMDRASAMTSYWWVWHTTYDFFNNNNPRPPQTKPNQLLNSSEGQWVQGIPYTYGGFETPYSRSDWGGEKWTTWEGALSYYRPNNGPLIGNISTYVYGAHQGDGLSAGVDCSGMVYAALGDTANPKKGTSSLMADGLNADHRVAGQPGNYYVIDGPSVFHVLFYRDRRLDGLGMNTLESTTDGSPQGAKLYNRSFLSVSGWTHKSWWAYGAGEGPAQAYTVWNSKSTCLRGMNTWYRFTVNGGTNVTLYNITGGDVDLYVYRQSDYSLVGSSTNGGSANDLVPINPGSYYAVVHHYSVGVCVSFSMWW